MFSMTWHYGLAAMAAFTLLAGTPPAHAQSEDTWDFDPGDTEPPPPEGGDTDAGDRPLPTPPAPRDTGAEEPSSVRVFEPDDGEPAVVILGETADQEVAEAEAPPPPRRPYSGPPTLLGQDGPLAYGGYGGVDVRYGRLANHDALLVGGEAALLLNHRLAIGVGGLGLANLVDGPPSSEGNASYMGFGYGGLVIRHNFVNQRLVYLSVGTLVGAGGIGFFEEVGEYEYEYDLEEFDEDPFFVVEPSLGIHLNVTRWLRVGGSVSYRYTKGIDCEGFTDRDFRGPSAGGQVAFGWF